MDEQPTVHHEPHVSEQPVRERKPALEKKYLYIVGGIAALIVLGILIYIVSVRSIQPRNMTTVATMATPTPTVPMKTEYENPFDKKSTYENPFTESSSYKNPFDTSQ